jgi:hypothetical protein
MLEYDRLKTGEWASCLSDLILFGYDLVWVRSMTQLNVLGIS